MKTYLLRLSVLVLVGCGSNSITPDAAGPDAAASDDAAAIDAAAIDAGAIDAGAGTDGGSDAGPSTTYPAPHPAPPQLTLGTGHVLTAPVFVPVSFSNDDGTLITQATDFLSHLGSSSYWLATTSEYGVGAGSMGGAVALSEMANGTIDDVAIQAWLADKVQSNDPAFPVVTAGTVFVLFYPAGVIVTVGGATGCTEFGSYHSEITLDSSHGGIAVPYVVVPRCASFGGLSGIEALTAVTSGTLVDAATDPQVLTDPAWAEPDDAHFAWELVDGGGEASSLCGQDPAAFATFPGLAYTVQRTWSNAAATAGHDPCVPALAGEVYFAAVPVLPDTAALGSLGVTTDSVRIAVGSTRTIEVDLFSDAATTGPMTVSALDYHALAGGTATLSLSVDSPSGLNGQHLALSITALSASPGGAEPFVLRATIGTESHLWVGVVTH